MTRSWSWLRVALVVAAVVICASLAETQYAGGGDAPYHLLTAQAWAAGSGLDTSEPLQVKFPPGWTLLLVPVQRLFGGSYAASARFAATWLVALACAAWLFLRQRDRELAPWLLAVLIASAALFSLGTRSVRSDIPFAAFATGYFAWSEAVLAGGARNARRARGIAIGAGLLTGVVLLRTIGVALVIGSIVALAHMLVTRRRRELAVVAVPVACAAIASAIWRRMAMAPAVEHYAGELQNLYTHQFWMLDPHRPSLGTATMLDVVLRVPGNLRMLAARSCELLLNVPWISPEWTSPVVILVAVLLFAGLVVELRRSVPIVAYSTIAYVGILAVWPFDEGTRFIAPLLPVLLLLVVRGWRAAIAWILRSPRSVAGAVMIVSALELVALAWIAAKSFVPLTLQQVAAAACWSALALGAVWMRWTLRSRTPSPGDTARSDRTHARLEHTTNVLRVALPRLVLATYVVLGAFQIVRTAQENVRTQVARNDFQWISTWLASHAHPADVVMAQRNYDFQMTTGLRTVLFPVTSDRDVLRAALESGRPRFLVIYASTLDDAYYFPLETDRLARISGLPGWRPALRAHAGNISVYELARPASARRAPIDVR